MSAEPGQLLARADEERVWQSEFEAGADTPSATRRWLVSSLREYVIRERLETAMLLVEELVASSMRRALANQAITVLLTVKPQLLRVDVIDAAHDSGQVVHTAMRGPVSGLVMVGRSAGSWGMTVGPPVHVWFEI
jgi:hypothetical protein